MFAAPLKGKKKKRRISMGNQLVSGTVMFTMLTGMGGDLVSYATYWYIEHAKELLEGSLS